MNYKEYEFPDELYYDKNHGWMRVEGDIATQGVNGFAAKTSGEIVYAEVPRVGRAVEQGKPFMSMESGKWVGRIHALVSGTIIEANEELEWEATIINKSPYGDGWLAKIECSDLGELDNLLRTSDPEFLDFIKEEEKKWEEAAK